MNEDEVNQLVDDTRRLTLREARYLPPRMKRNLTVGLDARWLELVRDQHTGYNIGSEDPRMADLVSDARQAYALGIILYLPEWAR